MLFRLFLAVACLHHAFCASRASRSILCSWRKICHYEMLPEFRCYNLSSPYTNSECVLPASPTAQKIQFKLFTNNNKATPDILRVGSTSSVSSSHIVEYGKVAFIIHGFTDNSNASWVSSLVKELLVRVPNVIAVDWSTGAKGPFYPQATANTRVVGAQIATMIKTMIDANVGVTHGNIHLIGHSLGAHVAGYAGETFKTPKIGRITGLDPAAPNFESYDILVRLDPSDAAFVDVIHTSAYPLIYGGLGTKNDCGHVDFWPNGGKYMPGCPETKSLFSLTPWSVFTVWKIWTNSKAGSCNHGKARDYFIASVNHNCFEFDICGHSYTLAHRNWHNNMGYNACPDRPGRYCSLTGATYPFTYRVG